MKDNRSVIDESDVRNELSDVRNELSKTRAELSNARASANDYKLGFFFTIFVLVMFDLMTTGGKITLLAISAIVLPFVWAGLLALVFIAIPFWIYMAIETVVKKVGSKK